MSRMKGGAVRASRHGSLRDHANMSATDDLESLNEDEEDGTHLVPLLPLSSTFQ